MTYAPTVEKALNIAQSQIGQDAGLLVLPSGPAVLPSLQ